MVAAMIASKRFPASKLLEKLVTPIRSITGCSPSSASRSFNTSAQTHDHDEDRSIDVDTRSNQPLYRRGGNDPFPGLISDVFDPFNPPRSLSQVLNLMDQFMDSPLASASRGMGSGFRRGWDVKEDNEALYLRMDMPGLGKENVKVSVEQSTLVIRGEREKESEDGETAGSRYSSRIDLPANLYKLDQIKAEMKNGVLKVVVPKVTEEERRDVVQVQIE